MLKVVFASLSGWLVLSSLTLLSTRMSSRRGTVPDFHIEGVGLFECQCRGYACPCQTNGAPTHGTCYAADFAHIKTGHYGNVNLDGLNVVNVGDLVDAEAKRLFATLCLGEKATSEPTERCSLGARQK